MPNASIVMDIEDFDDEYDCTTSMVYGALAETSDFEDSILYGFYLEVALYTNVRFAVELSTAILASRVTNDQACMFVYAALEMPAEMSGVDKLARLARDLSDDDTSNELLCTPMAALVLAFSQAPRISN